MIESSPIRRMLDNYPLGTNDQRRNALREIVQEIALVGLSRSNFFAHAAFYGKTALRIFHGLDRFSEDMDFSLATSEADFKLDTYLGPLRAELASWGFDMRVEIKEKQSEGAVQSSFLKINTLIHLVKITSIDPPVPGVSPNELISIKLEIDTDPPPFARFETKFRLEPIPYSVRLYDLPSLFAGKLHALLCRKWKVRVNGRDFYDYLWYLSKGVAVNRPHLEARMRQSGNWGSESLDAKALQTILQDRFNSVDYGQAKTDAAYFLKDTRALDLWNKEFFTSITHDRLKVLD